MSGNVNRQRMEVKGNHPLAEVIALKLFGINSVPAGEREKMVSRACRAAVEWYETRPAIDAGEIEGIINDFCNKKQTSLLYDGSKLLAQAIADKLNGGGA